MTAKPFRIVTPLPSLEKTAKRLGVSKAEVVRIEKMVDAAVRRSGKTAPERAGARKRASR
jgi:hypothetical protein